MERETLIFGTERNGQTLRVSGVGKEMGLHETRTTCGSTKKGQRSSIGSACVCHMTYSERRKAGVISPLACTTARKIDDARSLSRTNTARDSKTLQICQAQEINTHALCTPILSVLHALLSGPVAPSHEGVTSQGFLVLCLAPCRGKGEVHICMPHRKRSPRQLRP